MEKKLKAAAQQLVSSIINAKENDQIHFQLDISAGSYTIINFYVYKEEKDGFKLITSYKINKWSSTIEIASKVSEIKSILSGKVNPFKEEKNG